jgi:hypothetical protein
MLEEEPSISIHPIHHGELCVMTHSQTKMQTFSVNLLDLQTKCHCGNLTLKIHRRNFKGGISLNLTIRRTIRRNYKGGISLNLTIQYILTT